jgi:hypothetical protein
VSVSVCMRWGTRKPSREQQAKQRGRCWGLKYPGARSGPAQKTEQSTGTQTRRRGAWLGLKPGGQPVGCKSSDQQELHDRCQKRRRACARGARPTKSPQVTRIDQGLGLGLGGRCWLFVSGRTKPVPASNSGLADPPTSTDINIT